MTNTQQVVSRPLMFARALMMSCPNCGGRPVFRHWLAMMDDCPRCGISLVRGNRVGAYMLNLGASETVVAAVLLITLAATWPDPPWDLLTWLTPILALISPLFFYPFAKLVWVAIDLAMHPMGRRDEDPVP